MVLYKKKQTLARSNQKLGARQGHRLDASWCRFVGSERYGSKRCASVRRPTDPSGATALNVYFSTATKQSLRSPAKLCAQDVNTVCQRTLYPVGKTYSDSAVASETVELNGNINKAGD